MGGRKLARYVLEAVVGRCHKYSGPPAVKFTLRIRTWRGRNRRSDKSAGQDEKASAETSRLAPYHSAIVNMNAQREQNQVGCGTTRRGASRPTSPTAVVDRQKQPLPAFFMS